MPPVSRHSLCVLSTACLRHAGGGGGEVTAKGVARESCSPPPFGGIPKWSLPKVTVGGATRLAPFIAPTAIWRQASARPNARRTGPQCTAAHRIFRHPAALVAVVSVSPTVARPQAIRHSSNSSTRSYAPSACLSWAIAPVARFLVENQTGVRFRHRSKQAGPPCRKRPQLGANRRQRCIFCGTRRPAHHRQASTPSGRPVWRAWHTHASSANPSADWRWQLAGGPGRDG